MHFLILPVLKCSVSCGIGVQVRKVECILPTIVNGQNDSNENDQSTSLLSSSNGFDKTDSLSEIANDETNTGTYSNENLPIGCDLQSKPIATQQCTTGIECATIINENINGNSHEDVAVETVNSSNKHKNHDAEHVNGEHINVDENVDVSIETDVDDDMDAEAANLDNKGDGDSEEIEETEVFTIALLTSIDFCSSLGI